MRRRRTGVTSHKKKRKKREEEELEEEEKKKEDWDDVQEIESDTHDIEMYTLKESKNPKRSKSATFRKCGLNLTRELFFIAS